MIDIQLRQGKLSLNVARYIFCYGGFLEPNCGLEQLCGVDRMCSHDMMTGNLGNEIIWSGTWYRFNLNLKLMSQCSIPDWKYCMLLESYWYRTLCETAPKSRVSCISLLLKFMPVLDTCGLLFCVLHLKKAWMLISEWWMYCLFGSQPQKIGPQQTSSIVTLVVYLDEEMQWAVIQFVWVRSNLFNVSCGTLEKKAWQSCS